MKVLISAAETSSDAHGAQLLRALKAQGQVDAFGVGGPRLQAEGLRTVVDARELLAMGFVEIFGRLPKIFSALKLVALSAELEKPDVAVVIDYPDFHFRLARRLKRLGVPVVYYIPPKVWVWRKKRIRTLRDRFAKVLSILPFEVEFYERERVPVKYVGNPLVDELPLGMTRAAARSRIGLGERDRALVLMPGSRPSELKHHVDLMLSSAARAASVLRSRGFLAPQERLVTLMPFPVTSDAVKLKAQVQDWVRRAEAEPGGVALDVRVSQGDAPECLVAAEAGLIKSGTSTLEAAMLRVPHGIVYRPNRLTEFIFKHLIRYRGPVGLSNLVAGWEPGRPFLVNEILCSDATEEALSDEIVSLFLDSEKRDRLQRGFETLRARIITEASPSAVAAREILALAAGRRS